MLRVAIGLTLEQRWRCSWRRWRRARRGRRWRRAGVNPSRDPPAASVPLLLQNHVPGAYGAAACRLDRHLALCGVWHPCRRFPPVAIVLRRLPQRLAQAVAHAGRRAPRWRAAARLQRELGTARWAPRQAPPIPYKWYKAQKHPLLRGAKARALDGARSAERRPFPGRGVQLKTGQKEKR